MKRSWIFLLLAAVLFMHCAGNKSTTLPDDTLESLMAEAEAADESDQLTMLEPIPEESDPVIERTPPPPPPMEMPTFANVQFEYDRAELTPRARAVLSEHARNLNEFNQIRILIEGHCDERGTIAYNLALGERRAMAVKIYLMNYGIHPDRLRTISYGKEKPIDLRHAEEAWSLNRRAQFKIIE